MNIPHLRFNSDKRGVTAIEFGMLAIPFLMMLVGILDLAHFGWIRATASGELNRLARSSTVENGDWTAAQNILIAQVKRIHPQATVNVTSKSFPQYSRINAAEKLIEDKGATGYHVGEGDCFEDLNNDSIRNNVAGANGIGGADDVVLMTADISFPRLFPAARMFGMSPIQTLTVTESFRRQPYDNQVPPRIRCL